MTLAAVSRQVSSTKTKSASLGVLLLGHDNPAALGDMKHSESFEYDVYYRMVPGLTFSMCQSGQLTPEVEQNFIEAIKWLDEAKQVSAITSDCASVIRFQSLARKHTKKPLLLSSLVQLGAIASAYGRNEQIALFTANGKTLMSMHELISDECGVDVRDQRYLIAGCENVPGFEAVAKGEKVNTEKISAGIVALAKDILQKNPHVRALLLECTELSPYAHALRLALGIPVFSAITCANMFIDGMKGSCTSGDNLSLEENTNWKNNFFPEI